MSKLKNTKKGMAKKALSVSLVAAMLATSNVPVWAAEDLFSDGEAAVEAPAEVPVQNEIIPDANDTEVFGDASTEESEAAVQAVESTEGNSISAPKTTLQINSREGKVGWATNVTVSGKVLDKDGYEINRYRYAWVIDGQIGNKHGVDFGSVYYGQEIPDYVVTANDIGKEIKLQLFEDNSTVIGNDSYVYETKPVTISKANVDLDLPDDFNRKYISYDKNGQNIQHILTYNGQKQSFEDGVNGDLALWAVFDRVKLNKNDFTVTTSLINGNGVDSGSVYTITATPKDKDKYTGTLQYDYKIVDKVAEQKDFTVSIGKSYEYTGKEIVPNISDIKVTENLAKKSLDANQVVKSVEVQTGTSINPGMGSATVKLHNVQNFTEDSVENLTNYMSTYSIVKRDLSKCKIAVSTIAYTGVKLEDNDPRFNGKIHFYDSESGDVVLLTNDDYDIHVSGQPTDGTKDYTVEIKAKGSNTINWQSLSFQLGSETFDKNGYKLTDASLEHLTAPVTYTGKTAVKDASKVVFTNNKGEKLSSEEYEVIVEGVNAGLGKVTIKGLRSYSDCEEVYYFTIKPAKASHFSYNQNVVFVKGYKDASDYASALDVKVPGLNPEDYKVTYSFGTRNEINGKINIKVQILNKNYVNDVQEGTATICKRNLSNAEITVGSYVYTGGTIVPKLTVMDGNEPLTEGVDYKIVDLENAKNVGTATFNIVGVGDNNDPSNGIYDTTVKKAGKFEITPANASDIKVEFAEGNTGIVYTGSTIKPTIIKITLNGNDVSQQFDYEYPNTNVNVGTGHVILKPVVGNKNFIGQKDAEFTIKPAVLEGTLKVYDENGKQYGISRRTVGDTTVNILLDPATRRPVSFAYDGNAHTFADVKFVPASTGVSKFATADDYEIVYYDNTYGKVIGAEYNLENYDGIAYVAVVAKGNFTGGNDIVNAADETIHTVDAYAFGIQKYEILKQHVTVSDGEYAEGQPVRPNVTVTVGGKTLVENKDYKLLYNSMSDLTNGKTMNVEVVGVNGYKGSVMAKWGVVKKDMANTQVAIKSESTPSVIVYNSGVVVPETEYDVTRADNGAITITAKANSKYYTGSQTIEVPALAKGDLAEAVITGVKDTEFTGAQITPDVQVVYKNIILKEGEDYTVTYGENTAIGEGTVTVTAVEGSSYKGSQTVTFQITEKIPEVGKAAIARVDVINNKATVVLDGNASKATGYDYVIATVENTQDGRVAINKNQVANASTFQYLQKGVYYAYCHAWKRGEDGKKVFGEWSNIVRFEVGTITPAQPVITNVKVSGSTVTVTYTKAANATGYDIVLGSKVGKVLDEKRPIEYGTLVSKVTKGTTVTATFKNVEKGTYYAGLHAYNRTAADGKKVFSPWSNIKTVKVK